MNKPLGKFLIILSVLLAGCSKNASSSSSSNGKQSGSHNDDIRRDYQCSITWEGNTPKATFSVPDGSMTSEEIAPLFDEKISQKVLTYATPSANGTRERAVKYVLKEDAEVSFESSTNNEEFAFLNVDINAPEVVNYLRANTLQDQYDTLVQARGKTLDYSIYTLPVNTYGSEQSTIFLSSDVSFTTNVSKYSCADETYSLTNLIPGNTYYWKAVGKSSGDEFNGGVFKVNEDNIRFCNFDRIGNMRDLGGWKIGEHQRIKYGLIVRGRNPDSINPVQKEQVTNEFGFKTQIDLRQDADGVIKVKICPNVNYYFMNIAQSYNAAIDADRYLNAKANKIDSPDEDNGRRLTYKEIYAKIFNVLSRQESYPLYFHCVHGADRTGTLAYLLEGVLGVSMDDIIRDYELTSFNAKSGMRTRRAEKSDHSGFVDPATEYNKSAGNFENLTLLIEKESGSTFKDKVESYLVNKMGIPLETINAIRSILIENID